MREWVIRSWDYLVLTVKGSRLRKEMNQPLTQEEKKERMDWLREQYRREEEYEDG